MATLYIEEYQHLARDAAGALVEIPERLIATQKVTVGAASTAVTNAWAGQTTYLVLTSDVNCQIEFATSPTADGDSRFLPAGVPRGFSIKEGSKVAVIEQQ